MTPTQIIVLLIVLSVIPTTITAAYNCAEASQELCAAPGDTCQYYVWNNGTCVKPDACPSATIWSNSTLNCQVCSGTVSLDCNGPCATFGYYYDNTLSKCTLCSKKFGDNCVTCTQGTCSTCKTNFTLSSTNTSCNDPLCKIEYCQTCSNQSSCSLCDKNHKLFGNTCICSLSNCQTCTQTPPQVCTKCLTGYLLNQNKDCVLICIDNCKACSDSTSCTTCAVGYLYVNPTKKCVLDCTKIDVKNCKTCDSKTVCIQCVQGYSVSQLGNECLVQCNDTNCAVCTDATAGTCTSCVSGYKLSGTTGTCILDLCVIDFCTVCNSSTACKTCLNNYELSIDSLACNPICMKQDPKCLECLDGIKCKFCTAGYKPLLNGTCVQICTISNCVTCKSQTTCSACSEGYKVSAIQTKCQFDCGIDNCINCDSTTNCKTCDDGYQLRDNSCLPKCVKGKYMGDSACTDCPANCLSCQASKAGPVCNQCSSFYYIDSNFVCQPCTGVKTNCFDCSSSTKCTDCIEGFILDNGECQNKSTAVKCTVPSCDKCKIDDGTVCLTCNQGYDLTANSACQKPLCDGEQQVINGACSCGDSLYYSNKKCKPCKEKCLTCTALACSLCQDGYYPDGQLCAKCSSHCESCTSNSNCKKCQSGYSLIGKSCQKQECGQPIASIGGKKVICPNGCSACGADSAGNIICNLAEDGFVIDKGVIYKCDTTCLTCSNTQTNGKYQTCLTCFSGYAYNAGKCTTCTDQFALSCKKTDATYSLTCQSGYKPVDGLCVACPTNCLKCVINTVGDSCDIGGCSDGYIQLSGSSSKCFKCLGTCTVCNPANPNQCIGCGDYQYLKADKTGCATCGSNCITCTDDKTCTVCIPGYLLKSDGTCGVPPSSTTCVTFDKGTLLCINCTAGYVLTGSQCTKSMDCNTNKNCTDCAVNYYLSINKQCVACPASASCRVCKLLDSTKCDLCAKGYYMNSDYTCTACKTGCIDCKNEAFCNQAGAGYYLKMTPQNKNSGKCKKCDSPCATCNLDSDYCTTCIAGHTLTGSTCMNDNNYAINMVASLKTLPNGGDSNQQQGQLFQVLLNILKTLMQTMKFTDQKKFKQNFVMFKAKKGSIVLDMAVSTTAVNGNPSTAIMDAPFADLGGIRATAVENTAATTSSSTSDVSLGLVLGVAIPLGVLLIAIIVIIKVKYSSNTQTDDAFDPSQKQIEYNDQF